MNDHNQGQAGDNFYGLAQMHAAQLSRLPSIMQQLRDKVAELRSNLAKVDTWKAELAQAERMLEAGYEKGQAGVT